MSNQLTGTASADFLIGTAADDLISGLGGNDTLDGGIGSDTLNGGAGDDSLTGGAGNDTFVVDLGSDTIADLGAADVLVVSALATANATVGAAFTATSASSNAGIATLTSAGFAVDLSAITSTTNGFAVTNSSTTGTTLAGSSGADTLTGGAGSDKIFGLGGADILSGGAGHDSLTGGPGDDTLDGGAILDRFDFTDSNVASYTDSKAAIQVDLAIGKAQDGFGSTDTLSNISVIIGSDFADKITGSSNSNAESFSGGPGDDTIDGGAITELPNLNNVVQPIGNSNLIDYQYAGAAVIVDLRAGTASGGEGNDQLININMAYGSQYNDQLYGSDSETLVESFSGSDGNDTIDGRGGFDVVNFPSAKVAVTVDLGKGTALDGKGGTDTLLNIEGVRGTGFGDSLTGSSADNWLFGGGGNDMLSGGAGNDTLVGGAGRDTLLGGAGNDSMDGGEILDRINYTDLNVVSYGGSTAGIDLSLTTGQAKDGLGGTDTLVNINFLIGSPFGDKITGSSAMLFEQIEGGLGDDTLDGGVITDTLNLTNVNRASYQYASAAVTVDLQAGTATGGAGNDTLLHFNMVLGSNYNDTLLGSSSTLTELLEGGPGNDTIDGRSGFDIVRYNSSTSAVSVNLAAGTSSDGYGGTDQLLNIEGITGSAYNDLLTGGNLANGSGAIDGLEVFEGMAGNDTIDGGAGYDRADYHHSPSAVNVTLGGNAQGSASDGWYVTSDGRPGTDILINIEAARGSDFNDTLTGSDSGVFESFDGRAGNDLIDGKGGIDRADYQNVIGAVSVDLSKNIASQDGFGTTDTLLNIENVRGSRDFNDLLIGNAGDNLLEGLGGNDTLIGSGGNDTAIYSGARSDYSLTYNADGSLTVQDLRTASASLLDGTDLLRNIESLQFTDQALAVGSSLSLLAYDWNQHILISGVTAASGTLSTATGSSGDAFLGGATSATLLASHSISGTEAAAASQAVNLQDAIAILKMIVGLPVNGAGKDLSPYQAYAADYDGNGKIELSDAIGVLKHVVGLDAPTPQWLFFNEIDSTVPGKANLLPETVPALSVDLSGASPIHVGLVGVLRGDVDGSYAGAAGALDLDTDATHVNYFTLLLAAHRELSPAQFGIYFP